MPIHIPTSQEVSVLKSIKFLRFLRGMTQDDLAKRVGTHMWRIAHLEKGSVKPRPGEVAKILEVLSTGPQEDHPA